MPVVLLFATVTMLVLRAGASRIFFDVVGSFQATRLIGDAQAKITVLQGLVLDGLSGITEGVGLIGEQMQMLVDSTVPLAQEIGFARIEFEKFVQSGDDAAELAAQIEHLGSQFGFTADQALAAGSRMAQLSSVVGGGAAIPAATQVGIAFGMVGGMTTEEAMKKMIALQQQTGFMFGELTEAQFNRLTAEEKANVIRTNSIRLLNQLNTIENRSSATMSQATFVMNQFASSAKLAGDDIEFMAAMSATLIEAGEEQGKAGRALKMMYARLGADTGKNSEILAKYGVTTKEASGELRSMKDIISDVSDAIDRLAKDQQDQAKMEMAQAIAGNDHYVRAIKLINGKARTLQLETMAIQELDTAQSELNLRFEDNAFLLQQAESRLVDAKAAVGQIFTPAVIRATNAQAALNEELAILAESEGLDGSVVRFLAGGLFQAQQMGQIFAPMVEANLNVMSLTVSLQTQLQIQRAIGGQALVNASAYGRQGEMVRANLMGITSMVNIENRRALTAASLLRMDNSAAQLREQMLRLSQGEVTNNLSSLTTRKRLLEQGIFSLQTKQNEMNVLKVMDRTQHDSLLAEDQSLQLKKSALMAEQQQLQIIDKKTAYERARVGRGRYETIEAERLMSYKQGHFIHAKAEAEMEKSVNQFKQRGLQLEMDILEIEAQRGALNIPFTNMEKNALNIKKQQLRLTNQQIAEEGERAIFSMMNAQAIGGETQAAKILRNAHIELIGITRQKSSAEVQNNAIMEQAEKAARDLAMAYGLDEAALRSLIPQIQIFRAALDGVEEQSKMTVNAAMALNMQIMKFTGVLGAASMGLSLFSENEDAARASMMLMTLSMVPMTFQMFTASASSMALLGSFKKLDKGAKATSMSLKGVAAAAGKVGIALGIVTAVGIAFVALSRAMGRAEDDTDKLSASFDNLNQTVSLNQEMYGGIAENLSDKTILDILGEVESTESKIAEIKKGLETSTNPILIDQLNQELGILEDQLVIQEDILAARQASFLTENESAATTFFNDMKALQAAEQDLAEAHQRSPRLFGTLPTGALGRTAEDFFGANLLAPLPNVFYDPEETAAVAAYNDALAKIPENMQGAIVEAAATSATVEEFNNRLVAMMDDPDFENPFGDFGSNLNSNFIGPIEAAKEAAFEFSNAREEMFFGMAKGNITGDMVKQVVNKGVETLINTTEVIMTNNFTGMTTAQAANEITKQVVVQLNGLGLNIQQPA